MFYGVYTINRGTASKKMSKLPGRRGRAAVRCYGGRGVQVVCVTQPVQNEGL